MTIQNLNCKSSNEILNITCNIALKKIYTFRWDLILYEIDETQENKLDTTDVNMCAGFQRQTSFNFF